MGESCSIPLLHANKYVGGEKLPRHHHGADDDDDNFLLLLLLLWLISWLQRRQEQLSLMFAILLTDRRLCSRFSQLPARSSS
jgi:hypothetical protein